MLFTTSFFTRCHFVFFYFCLLPEERNCEVIKQEGVAKRLSIYNHMQNVQHSNKFLPTCDQKRPQESLGLFIEISIPRVNNVFLSVCFLVVTASHHICPFMWNHGVRENGWSLLIFMRPRSPEILGFLCNRHFLADCFLNFGQFTAGMADHLVLAPNLIPSLF